MQYVRRLKLSLKIVNAIKRANYGTLKIWTNRIRANVTLLQTLMIFYLFLEKANWHWWYVPILLLFFFLSIYDNDKGLHQEIEYMNRRNKMWMEMYNKIMEKK